MHLIIDDSVCIKGIVVDQSYQITFTKLAIQRYIILGLIGINYLTLAPMLARRLFSWFSCHFPASPVLITFHK